MRVNKNKCSIVGVSILTPIELRSTFCLFLKFGQTILLRVLMLNF